MWVLGWAKCLNYKSQRQHLKAFWNYLHVDFRVGKVSELQATEKNLKAFRNALPHMDSRVGKVSELQVTETTFKSISECFTSCGLGWVGGDFGSIVHSTIF